MSCVYFLVQRHSPVPHQRHSPISQRHSPIQQRHSPIQKAPFACSPAALTSAAASLSRHASSLASACWAQRRPRHPPILFLQAHFPPLEGQFPGKTQLLWSSRSIGLSTAPTGFTLDPVSTLPKPRPYVDSYHSSCSNNNSNMEEASTC